MLFGYGHVGTEAFGKGYDIVVLGCLWFAVLEGVVNVVGRRVVVKVVWRRVVVVV